MLTADYNTIDQDLSETTALNGTTYTVDNGRVYDLFKQLIVEGSAWSFAKQFDATHNGRAAYLAVKSQAEGPAAISHKKSGL
jgi:hypothetical protein